MRTWRTIALGAVLAAVMAVPAQAATTRADFVAQADPICQNGLAQEAVAIQPVIRAAKRVKKHHSRKAAKRFDRAFSFYFAQFANIERAVNAQIATVPVAPDDVSLIQVWLRARGELLDVESRLFLSPTEGKGLKGFAQVFNDLFELIGRQLEVSDLVRDFGFQYCTLGQPELQIIR